ncbi:MAG: FAD-dependent monooxygenase [Myxococcota bacterium]|jgi:flavin-dependent dehydrogenase|nr:FAD-dependent monooxygenase [Myxococcota bacterium]
MKSYDVAIVGAGPGGSHAAKWCAKKGLKVVVIEKRKDTSKITRYCSEHIILDKDYNGDTIVLEPAEKPGTDGFIPPNPHHKIRSTNFGWVVDYKGALCPVTDKKYFSADLKSFAHFAWPDRRPFAYKYDKGTMIAGVLAEALALGVDYMNETICYSAADFKDHVELKCVSKGKRFKVHAKKLIAADGASAQLGQTLGINKERVHFVDALVLAVYMSGVHGYSPHDWCGYWGSVYGSNLAPLMGTGPSEHFEWADVILLGHRQQLPWDSFHYFTQKSPVAWMFKDAKIERSHSCNTRAFSPLKVPYKGNCLLIGDAAAFVETQAQGALNCGFWAADAVAKELGGQPGYEEYSQTWQKAFEFHGDGMKQVTSGYGLVPYYTDEEIVYLFSLLKGVTLDGSWSQYKSPRMMWGEIHRHRDRIQQERPEIWAKIQNQQSKTLEDSMSK